jgi:hypothetical protein
MKLKSALLMFIEKTYIKNNHYRDAAKISLLLFKTIFSYSKPSTKYKKNNFCVVRLASKQTLATEEYNSQ